MTIVDTATMRELEDRCFAQGMPVAALMEKAGLKVFARIVALYPKSRFPRVVVLAGPGHNGGDALVIARELFLEGRHVTVWFPWPSPRELTAAHVAHFRAIGGEVTGRIGDLKEPDLIIDGLFGFGLERMVEGPGLEAMHWANTRRSVAVAIDVPSGINTDTGQVLGSALRVTRTFCLGHWKRGLLESRAAPHTGELELVDIGLPEPDTCKDHVIRPANYIDLIPPMRSRDANKYTAGRALLVAGSEQYPGAAILALLGCRAAGAGYVAVNSHREIRNLLLLAAPDSIFLSQLPPTPETLGRWDAILCGPGLGEQTEVVDAVLRGASKPIVLDADGINVLADNPTWRSRIQVPVVITPHEGEFQRLFPDLANITSRLDAARQAAQRSGFVVVLKGPRTIIARPDGHCYVNLESTPALARAGTGDVLAGLLTGLIAQGIDPGRAAVAAVAWHSLTARKLEDLLTPSGVNAQSLAQHLPDAAAQLRASVQPAL